MRDVLIVLGAVALAMILFGIAMVWKPATTTQTATTTEPQSIVIYRAGERADWGNPVLTEPQSIVVYRTGERDSQVTEADSLVQFRAAERASR